jgi:acetamidase/formamidase
LKELIAGTSVFLPVHEPGALLSIGDGHAAQGDGEVSGTAIETSLKGRIRVILHRGRGSFLWPRAETPTHYLSLGLDEDLDEAARIATSEMVRFLADEKGLSREDAYLLASVAVDLRVTQLVDGTKSHAMLEVALSLTLDPPLSSSARRGLCGFPPVECGVASSKRLPRVDYGYRPQAVLTVAGTPPRPPRSSKASLFSG